MTNISRHISHAFCVLSISVLIIAVGCQKKVDPPAPDPTPPVVVDTSKPLTSATGECRITRITQRNGSGTKADYAFEVKRDANTLTAINISSYDSLLNRLEYTISITTVGDTTKLSTGEYFISDPTTKLINSFSTRADLSDVNSDKQLYQYAYNANGYLVKKLCYINGSASAFYETQYTYDANNLLTGCVVYAGSKKDKLIQSVLDYDISTARKAWIYLFPDFFEGYQYLQTFNFGKKSTYPVKSIVTKVYDISNGAELDTWSTTFSDYVYSSDNFILQTTAKGDLQQGLGLLFGTTKFEYLCTK